MVCVNGYKSGLVLVSFKHLEIFFTFLFNPLPESVAALFNFQFTLTEIQIEKVAVTHINPIHLQTNINLLIGLPVDSDVRYVC